MRASRQQSSKWPAHRCPSAFDILPCLATIAATAFFDRDLDEPGPEDLRAPGPEPKTTAALVADGADIDNALDLDAAVPKAPGGLFGDDADLTTAAMLRQTLKWQTDTAGLDIAVDVDGGSVHLNGNVGTTAERDRVVSLASITEGVDRVFSYISVDPELIPAIRDRQAKVAGVDHSDSWISSRLLRLLRFDTTVNAHSVEVEALEGKVILSGTVTSSAERGVAETLAERVPGVTAVDSRLIIERPL